MRVKDECKAFVGQCLCSFCLKPLQLCSKIIAITRQSHRFYILIALLLFFKFYIPEKSLLYFLQNDMPLLLPIYIISTP